MVYVVLLPEFYVLLVVLRQQQVYNVLVLECEPPECQLPKILTPKMAPLHKIRKSSLLWYHHHFI